MDGSGIHRCFADPCGQCVRPDAATPEDMLNMLKNDPRRSGQFIIVAFSCLVFATRLAEGVKSPEGCPELSVKSRQNLEAYLGGFQFEDLPFL